MIDEEDENYGEPESDEEFYGSSEEESSEEEYKYEISEDEELDAEMSQDQARQADEQKSNQLQAQAEQKSDASAADAQAELDKANQKLADMPGKIEDTVNDLKKKFEALLGKVDTPKTDPSSPDFDVNELTGKLNGIVQPVIGATAPLTAVAGSVPVIGDLAGLFSKMSSSSSPASDMSKEDIEKMVPNPPEIPPAIINSIEALIQTIKTVCITLPMMLVNLIFMMINIIYSKLQIITSVIPLGDFFPLSLIGSALSAVPKIQTFIMQAPAMIKDMVMGVVKGKMAEAQALGVSQPPSQESLAAAAGQSAAGKAADAASGESSGVASSNSGGGGSGSGGSGAESSEQGASGSEGSSSDSGKNAEEMLAELDADQHPSAVKDVQQVKENPPVADVQPTIPSLAEKYKEILNERMQVFRRHPQFQCVFKAMDGKKYDYGENFAYVFNSAYMQNDDWSDKELKNGKQTEDELLRYIKIFDNMDEYVKSPEKDEDGTVRFVPYQLFIDDYTQAVAKKKRSPSSQKIVNPAEDAEYKYGNALFCYSKSIVDTFRLTPDSPEFKSWETAIKDYAKSKRDRAATADQKAGLKSLAGRLRLGADKLESNLTKFKQLIERKDIFIFNAKLLPESDKLMNADINPAWMEESPSTGETWPVEP